MPIAITDVDAFTDPVNAPIDGDSLNAASIVTNSVQPLANRTRNLANRTGNGDGLGEFAYDDAPRTRTRVVSVAAFSPLSQFGNNDTWDQSPGVSGGAFTGPHIAVGGSAAENTLSLDVGALLPPGGTLKQIRTVIQPASARAVGDRMSCLLIRNTPDFATPAASAGAALITEAEDDGGTGVQLFDTGTITESVDRTSTIVWIIKKGDGGIDNDTIWDTEITYEDPGPINF